MEAVATGVRGREQARAKVFVESIVIENFKSIRRLELRLRPGLNVLVGPNASGKSNILEAIYFLYKALVEEAGKTPYMPHIPDYWSPLDLLYNRDPAARLTYRLRMLYRVLKDDRVIEAPIELQVVFMASLDASTILPVEMALSYGEADTELVLRKGEAVLRIRREFLDVVKERGSIDAKKTLRKASKEGGYLVRVFEPTVAPINPMQLLDSPLAILEVVERDEKTIVYGEHLIPPIFAILPVVSKATLKSPDEFKGYPLPGTSTFHVVIPGISKVLEGIMLLKHPDVGRLREPQPLLKSERLNVRAANLVPVLYALLGRYGGLPERFTHALAELFPGTRIRPEISHGRAALYVEEDGLELPPPNIPDGLFKLLSILAAVELGPSILLIDEIENSLHRAMIEYVVDTLDSLEVPVLVATHSPIVVDLVGPEKTLVTVKKPGEGTTVEVFEDPQELSRRLDELGVAFSDYVFYGEASQA